MSYKYRKEAEPHRHDQPDTAGKTETFFTRHVKLITFLICMSVFLTVFIPVAYFGIDMVIDWTQRDERAQMTVENVIYLSELERDLYLSDLTAYQGELSEYDYETHYAIEIEPHYYIRAVAENRTEKLIYFEIVSTKTGVQISILTDDVRAFFNSN